MSNKTNHKRSRSLAGIASRKEVPRLRNKKTPDLTVLGWLIAQTPTGQRSKASIDAELKVERDW